LITGVGPRCYEFGRKAREQNPRFSFRYRGFTAK